MLYQPSAIPTIRAKPTRMAAKLLMGRSFLRTELRTTAGRVRSYPRPRRTFVGLAASVVGGGARLKQNGPRPGGVPGHPTAAQATGRQ